MTSIWSFLLQTLSVTLVAGLLLLLKHLFTHQLSPRWQYGIWGLLAVRILLPAGMERGVLLPRLPMWMEVCKTSVEQYLSSAYASSYAPISLTHIFPVFSAPPRSLTDALLVVYAAGVLVFALKYLVTYGRLRLLLRRGAPAGRAMEERLSAVCGRYGLNPCRMVAVPGLPSAFVCGIFRPVLAVPAGEEVDEKILLHELLHLKYRDAAQSAFWCALRCLHWCNPLLHMVFDRIGNDMEALCDQRVLERLEGEERREYGIILLSMANDRYARCPGTTSISNGGAFISQRIQAIVRFKKYPKGMGLVAVCMLAVLVSPTLYGTAMSFEDIDYTPSPARELPQAMAAARLERCSTVAGAIDCYAKGLMEENGIYIALASPLEAQESLVKDMLRASQEEGWAVYHRDSGVELDYLNKSAGYTVLDLTAQSDGSYAGYLAFEVNALADQYGHGWERSQSPDNTGHVILPIRVYESDGWCVEETDRRIFTSQVPEKDLPYPGEAYTSVGCPTKTLAAEGESGTVLISYRSHYTAGGEDTWSWPWDTSDDADVRDPDPHKELPEVTTLYDVAYTPSATPISSYTVEVIPLGEGEEPEFMTESYSNSYGNAYGYDADGSFTMKKWVEDENLSIGSIPHLADFQRAGEEALAPTVFHIRVFWDDAPVDTYALKEETT